MSQGPRRPRSDSMPALVWALLAVLVIALFVLVIALLHHPA
jgi:hypothetical protein